MFTLEQICALGLTGAGVRARAAAGRLHRIHHGVYSLVPAELLTRHGRWLAAVSACGPAAVLSHRSAAALHEIRRSDAARIDVTVAGRSRRGPAELRVHRSTTITPDDVAIVQGIPCTTIARTLLDLAEVVGRRSLERTFDQVEVIEKLDLRALDRLLERNATRPAAKLARALLAEHYAGSTLTWSELEERLLAILRDRGLPIPELNRLIDFGDGEPPVRADFVWREQRVLIETDGWRTHRTRQAFEYDRRLDQRALAAGWQAIRTTWRQLERRPEEVVATAAALLARR